MVNKKAIPKRQSGSIKNITKKLETMETLKNIWSTRKLSLKGKVVVLKTLMLPQVTYLLSVCYCPHYTLQKNR